MKKLGFAPCSLKICVGTAVAGEARADDVRAVVLLAIRTHSLYVKYKMLKKDNGGYAVRYI